LLPYFCRRKALPCANAPPCPRTPRKPHRRRTPSLEPPATTPGGRIQVRQHQIGLYICDFVSLDSRIVVELDGSQHAEQLAYDERRDNFLRSAGFRVLRFWNGDVHAHIENVIETIFEAMHRPEMDGRL